MFLEEFHFFFLFCVKGVRFTIYSTHLLTNYGDTCATGTHLMEIYKYVKYFLTKFLKPKLVQIQNEQIVTSIFNTRSQV